MQNKLYLIISFFLVLSSIAFGQDTFGHKLKGDVYYSTKNYESAVDEYTKAIKGHDGNDLFIFHVYVLRARCYKLLNQPDKAEEDYTAAIKITPDNYDAYWNRGLLREADKDYNGSIKDYYSALSFLETTDTVRRSTLYNNIALNYNRLNNLDSAFKCDSIAVLLNPTNYKAFRLVGRMYISRKDYPHAINSFIDAIRCDSNLNDTKYLSILYSDLAYSRMEIKLYKDAISNYSYALKLDSGNSLACWNRGAAHYRNKDYELAINDYTKAMGYYQDKKKELSLIYKDRAQCELGQSLEKTIQDDSMAIAIDPGNKLAYQSQARAYFQNGDFQRCVDLSKFILSSQKNTNKIKSNLYLQLAKSENFLNEFDNVLADCTTAISLNADNGPVYFTRAKVYFKQANQKDIAIKDFNKTLLLDSAKTYQSYIFSLYYTGKSDEAINILQQDISSNNDSIQVLDDYYNLACIYSLTKQPDKANQYLKMTIGKLYSKKYAAADEFLDNIRNTAGYKNIMDSVQ